MSTAKSLILPPGRTAVRSGVEVVAIPRRGVGLNEAKDKWLGAKDDTGKESNKVLDDGGRSDPRLLVGRESGKTMLYELVPELCPPGFTPAMAMEHMKKAGMDVRGEGPASPKGYPTIMVFEPDNMRIIQRGD